MKTDLILTTTKEKVGELETENPITGSIVNDAKIIKLTLFGDPPIEKFMDYLFEIKGSPRAQRIWDFKNLTLDSGNVVLTQVVLSPHGFCVACTGKGCPMCKNTGNVKVWLGDNNASNSEKN
jgi:hypothetical protein